MSDLAWMRPKLAELCGLKSRETVPYVITDYLLNGDYFCGVPSWRPDLDIAQAVRCLEALQRHRDFCCIKIGLYVGEGWEVKLWTHTSSHDKAVACVDQKSSLAETICLAIAAALGWEKP